VRIRQNIAKVAIKNTRRHGFDPKSSTLTLSRPVWPTAGGRAKTTQYTRFPRARAQSIGHHQRATASIRRLIYWLTMGSGSSIAPWAGKGARRGKQEGTERDDAGGGAPSLPVSPLLSIYVISHVLRLRSHDKTRRLSNWHSWLNPDNQLIVYRLLADSIDDAQAAKMRAPENQCTSKILPIQRQRLVVSNQSCLHEISRSSRAVATDWPSDWPIACLVARLNDWSVVRASEWLKSTSQRARRIVLRLVVAYMINRKSDCKCTESV